MTRGPGRAKIHIRYRSSVGRSLNRWNDGCAACDAESSVLRDCGTAFLVASMTADSFWCSVVLVFAGSISSIFGKEKVLFVGMLGIADTESQSRTLVRLKMQPAQPLRSATSSTTSLLHQASNPDQIMNAHPVSEASESLSLTPDKSHTEDRKRKRDVLSCLDCRRRKLKCDRGYPSCIRCQKGGNASSCTYASFPGESNGNGDDLGEQLEEDGRVAKRPRGAINGNQSLRRDLPSPSIPTHSSQTETIIQLGERLKTLESIVSQSFNREQLPAAVPMRTSVLKPEDVKPKEPETNFFKGRGVKTQFHGASCPTSILAHVSVPFAFKSEADNTSSLKCERSCKMHILTQLWPVFKTNVRQWKVLPRGRKQRISLDLLSNWLTWFLSGRLWIL